ncbi:MAG: hypothetical protein KTR35_20275 [Gammaproteobacteria bacterium]|nr:hypothetical protein [Gammaproteobacteria bacterium]
MIDEELYRLAQAELNSDQRRANIWSRACALARDDHDEARYLYTNLRVEEMIEEREAQKKHDLEKNTPTAGGKPRIRLDPDVMAQANEMVQSTDSHADDVRLESRNMADGDFAELDPTSMENFSSATDNTPTKSPVELNDDTLSALNSQANAHTNSLDGDAEQALTVSGPVDLAAEDPTGSDDTLALSDFDPTEITPAEHTNDYNLSEPPLAIDELDLDQFDDDVYNSTHHKAKLNAGGAPSANEQIVPDHAEDPGLEALDDLHYQPIQSAEESEQNHPLSNVSSEAYTQNRNADPLADFSHAAETEAIAEFADIPAEAESVAQLEEQARLEAESLASSQPVALERHTGEFGPGISHDYAPSHELDAEAIEQEIDREQASALISGKGKPFVVFTNEDGRTKAVKNGVSWTALVATFPWLLSKKLFGTALVYALLWLVLLGGLLLTGLAWLDAGASASLETKAVFALFGVMTLIGLFFIPFRYGNRWVAQKLIKKGFDYQTPVRAKNRRNAIDKVLQFAA